MVSSCRARFADRRRARDTIPPLPPATARRRAAAAKAITASCCQRYPLLCSSAGRTPMRKSAPCRTGAPKPAETATALYPAATAYGLRPTQQPGGGSYRGGLPVLQRRKREFTDLIAAPGADRSPQFCATSRQRSLRNRKFAEKRAENLPRLGRRLRRKQLSQRQDLHRLRIAGQQPLNDRLIFFTIQGAGGIHQRPARRRAWKALSISSR